MTASFSVAALDPDELTLSAATSTDDGVVTEYRFVVLPPLPGGASTSALQNHGQRTTQRLSTLRIPAGVTGTFRIGLEVWDDCGAKATTLEVLTLNVFP